MAYSAVGDLLIGDIPLPPRFGDGTKFIDMATDEIDSQIGHIYVTPIELEDIPANRPARLLLKKINNFIASGRMILDMAMAGEDRELQAYGKSLLREGLDLLGKISSGKIELPAVLINPTPASDSGPVVLNEDPESLVEGFYQVYSHGVPRITPMRPYKDRPLV
jgi:hypothetical protein